MTTRSVFTSRHDALVSLSFALLALSACGGATSTSIATEPVSALSPPEAARLVRQPSAEVALDTTLYVQADGLLRGARGDGWAVDVFDPRTRTVHAHERAPFAIAASTDPTFGTLCVTSREFRAGAPTEIGAFDLGRGVWRWRTQVLPEGALDMAARVLATNDACVVVVFDHGGGGHLELFASSDGARRDAAGIPLLGTEPETTAMWSDDRATLVLSSPAQSPDGLRAFHLDVRDGHTLEQRAVVWARCVEVDRTVRIGVDERIEDEARRVHLQRVVPDLLGPCEHGPEAIATSAAPPELPSPWAPISDDVVAVHDERGLFLWDHGHHGSPRAVVGAPPLVRYEDVNRRSRPHELVVPPDASWVGAIRADATMARFSASDGAPLPDVALPLVSAGDVPTPHDAEWQVFAGARDRLLAIRHVEAVRTVFVGDTSGHWTRSRARAYPSIAQYAEHEDETATWLVSDPHRGISRIDEATGEVVATFLLREALNARFTRTARSPDGTELFVGIAPESSDGHEGIYILDARTLAVRRRFPAGGWITGLVGDVEWVSDGVHVEVEGGLVILPRWARIDPSTGAGEIVARGPLEIAWSPTRRGTTHVTRAFGGGVFVTGADRGEPRWLGLYEGGAAIQEADGHLWCEGTGCERFRCVVGTRALETSDAACARLLLD